MDIKRQTCWTMPVANELELHRTFTHLLSRSTRPLPGASPSITSCCDTKAAWLWFTIRFLMRASVLGGKAPTNDTGSNSCISSSASLISGPKQSFSRYFIMAVGHMPLIDMSATGLRAAHIRPVKAGSGKTPDAGFELSRTK
jgi:hypothetical protein